MTNEKDSTEGLNVGQLLKKRRLQLKLSLAEVEVSTRIRGKYLVKLEFGQYADLPNDVYTRGFVVSYANFLGLDGNKLGQRYSQERGGDIETGEVAPKPVTKRRWVITTRWLTAAGVLLAALAVLAYLSWQFSALAAPPKLDIVNPPSDEVINSNLIDVTGHVTPGADVFINDSPILVDDNSNFKETLALQNGVNTIRITAKNKLGKTTTINRNILAHLPKLTSGQGSLPGATFNGVAIMVTITGSATAVDVNVDGQDIFRGTMLAGTTQVFQGSQKITLTTSNGGTTEVKVTNSIVANKDLGAVGASGQAVSNLVFETATQFQ